MEGQTSHGLHVGDHGYDSVLLNRRPLDERSLGRSDSNSNTDYSLQTHFATAARRNCKPVDANSWEVVIGFHANEIPRCFC